jgi:hypothetical protein
LEKSGAKNVYEPGRAGFAATGPGEQKVFAPLFSKSGHFLLPYHSAAPALICCLMSAESDQLREQIGRSAALLRRHL